MRCSSAPTPGGWTSMPMKSTCGAAAAIAAVALPMPKPISTTSGATRPNAAREVDRRGDERQHEARRQRRQRARLPGPDPAGADDEAADATRRRGERGVGGIGVGAVGMDRNAIVGSGFGGATISSRDAFAAMPFTRPAPRPLRSRAAAPRWRFAPRRDRSPRVGPAWPTPSPGAGVVAPRRTAGRRARATATPGKPPSVRASGAMRRGAFPGSTRATSRITTATDRCCRRGRACRCSTTGSSWPPARARTGSSIPSPRRRARATPTLTAGAAVVSVRAAYYFANRWVAQLKLNRVEANSGPGTTGILFGVGYQLDAPDRPGPRESAPARSGDVTGRRADLDVRPVDPEQPDLGDIDRRRARVPARPRHARST